jgi:cytochrome P450
MAATASTAGAHGPRARHATGAATPTADQLPPAPSMSVRRQVLGWILRPEWLMEQGRRERGDLFTLHLPFGPIVLLADPPAVKEVFTGDPAVLRAGEGNAPLEPVVGPESLLLLDGSKHLRRRRLVLPPFHGERLKTYANDMAELTERELATWPLNEAFALEPRMRAITLAVIIRVVFGIEDGERAAALRDLIPRLLPDGGLSSLVLIPALRRDFGPLSPWRRFLDAREEVDRLLFAEIAERRAAPPEELAARTDVLSLLLQARDEDGEPLTDHELRDELMTLLLAGHETTATALAWTFELLHRRPDAHARATAEARGPAEETPWLDAVATESLRLKPPIPSVVRRLTEPRTVLGHTLPAGTRLAPCIYLMHRRADLYPRPTAFLPERFADDKPETYTWLPFGGGIRRCVGAAFAQTELKAVLRTVLAHCDLQPASPTPERTRRRAVVLTPEHGARAVLTRRR